MFAVNMLSLNEVIFQGQAESIVFPGETGEFETLSYHKPVVSRLISGPVIIDGRQYPIRRGLMGFSQNKATIIVETDG